MPLGLFVFCNARPRWCLSGTGDKASCPLGDGVQIFLSYTNADSDRTPGVRGSADAVLGAVRVGWPLASAWAAAT